MIKFIKIDCTLVHSPVIVAEGVSPGFAHRISSGVQMVESKDHIVFIEKHFETRNKFFCLLTLVSQRDLDYRQGST